MGNIEVTLKSFKTTERLDKIILEVLAEDAQTVLRYVAASEIADQIAIGNPPTAIIVDNRGRKDIATAEKRVQAFFANTADLKNAVREAWQQVQALTRVASGRAQASYQVWYNETPIGSTPDTIDIYLARFNPAKDYFRIVGPVLVYGRKIYWNPKGQPKFVKKVLAKIPGLTIKITRIRGIMNTVEQSMRRRYRNLAIAEDWVVTSALPKDGRTPGLWIGFKRKGTLLQGGING
jgi:hypothetical protein